MVVRKIGFCEGMEAFLLYCKSKGLAERTVETLHTCPKTVLKRSWLKKVHLHRFRLPTS